MAASLIAPNLPLVATYVKVIIALVRLNNGSVDDVLFPFCEEPEYLDRMIKRRHVDRAAPHVVDAIRSLKPYKGGNVALRALHDLDVQDKHQSIIPIGDCASFESLPQETGIVIDKNSSFGPVQDGFYPFTFNAAPSLPVGREIPATFILTFAPLTTALGPVEVVPTLHSLADLVAEILQSFETLCFGQAGPPGSAP